MINLEAERHKRDQWAVRSPSASLLYLPPFKFALLTLLTVRELPPKT